jgi:hypothetical protein
VFVVQLFYPDEKGVIPFEKCIVHSRNSCAAGLMPAWSKPCQQPSSAQTRNTTAINKRG